MALEPSSPTADCLWALLSHVPHDDSAAMYVDAPNLSSAPPLPLGQQDEPGPSNSPEFSPQVFMGTPFSVPIPGEVTTTWHNPDGTQTTQMLLMNT